MLLALFYAFSCYVHALPAQVSGRLASFMLARSGIHVHVVMGAIVANGSIPGAVHATARSVGCMSMPQRLRILMWNARRSLSCLRLSFWCWGGCVPRDVCCCLGLCFRFWLAMVPPNLRSMRAQELLRTSMHVARRCCIGSSVLVVGCQVEQSKSWACVSRLGVDILCQEFACAVRVGAVAAQGQSHCGRL